MSEFKKIPKEQFLREHNIPISKWRHNLSYQIAGSLYYCGGGTVTIEMPDGSVHSSKTKNLAKRVDQLIANLMCPRMNKVNVSWIQEYKDKYGPLSIDDIENLNITVKSEQIKYTSKILEGIHETAGVYIITFPNGKKYLGQSKNIKHRLSEHFSYLSNYFNYKSAPDWYGICLKENPGLQLEKISIEFIAAKNCRELESEMLQSIEDRTQYYNRDFC